MVTCMCVYGYLYMYVWLPVHVCMLTCMRWPVRYEWCTSEWEGSCEPATMSGPTPTGHDSRPTLARRSSRMACCSTLNLVSGRLGDEALQKGLVSTG